MKHPQSSAIWYVIAFLILAAGVTWATIGFVGDIKYAQSQALTRFVMPASQDLKLTKSGGYTLYYEYQSDLNGEMFNTGEETDIQCSVTSPSGSKIAVQASGMSSSYSIGSRSGKALAAFSIDAPGTYALACAHANGSGPRVVVAVGQAFTASLLVGIFRDITILIVSFLLSAIIIVVTLVRRAR
ncbi:MAG TPA: hypothetical protein VN934_01820 [Candidatus Tumulicola sp.]|nr:hypothetical protein [Candidatus Tumulicola sp.]